MKGVSDYQPLMHSISVFMTPYQLSFNIFFEQVMILMTLTALAPALHLHTAHIAELCSLLMGCLVSASGYFGQKHCFDVLIRVFLFPVLTRKFNYLLKYNYRLSLPVRHWRSIFM